jgi:hypothetical protein
MYYRIMRDGRGSGGFLCPPGHPNHEYTLYGWSSQAKASRSGLDGAALIGSIESAASDSECPGSVKDQAARILANAPLACSEAWIRNVYGYFRNSYAPADRDRNVSRSVRNGPHGLHLGYLKVRDYFPDHAPRADLIENPGNGYGSHECVKCGGRVQYEARKDALCKVTSGPRWRYDADCPRGGGHEIAA